MQITEEQRRAFAKWFIEGISIGKYNRDLESALKGHRSARYHFKRWYGVDWEKAEFKEQPPLPEELKPLFFSDREADA